MRHARVLEKSRRAEQEDEKTFIVALKAHTDEHSSSDLAKALDVSTAYLCDLRYGRRKVSDSLLEKLGRVS